MINSITHYDVIIVRASVGGSTAAILFAQRGLRVALIERHRLYRQVQTGKTKRIPQVAALLRAIIRRWHAQAQSTPTVPTVEGR